MYAKSLKTGYDSKTEDQDLVSLLIIYLKEDIEMRLRYDNTYAVMISFFPDFHVS